MMTIPEAVVRAFSEALHMRVDHTEPVAGGMISRAARVKTDSGTYFVKWRADSPGGFFTAEADGLERLRKAKALRVPEIVYVADGPVSPGILILEYIERRAPSDRNGFAETLGCQLAQLHRTTLAPSSEFGLERDNFLGAYSRRVFWTPSGKHIRYLRATQSGTRCISSIIP